jgi:Fe2+ or Zn2+ uptake regulation protein
MKQSRNTPQRKLIVSILENNRSHPTADEIYQIARQKDAYISRGTVYRNLNFLVKEGVVLRLTTPDGPDHYDFALHGHYHFFCRKCHKVADVPLPYNEDFNRDLLGLPGYHTEWHQLMLVGLCPECSN